jgi:hypothetical protein
MICRPARLSGKFHPAKAGEFSHGAFHPFAKGANGDRCAAVNSTRLKPGNSRMAPSIRLQMAQTGIGAQRANPEVWRGFATTQEGESAAKMSRF